MPPWAMDPRYMHQSRAGSGKFFEFLPFFEPIGGRDGNETYWLSISSYYRGDKLVNAIWTK